MMDDRVASGPLLDSVALALEGHISPINVRVIMDRARRVLSDGSRVSSVEREKLLSAVRASGRLFVSSSGLEALVTAVAQALSTSDPGVTAARLIPWRTRTTCEPHGSPPARCARASAVRISSCSALQPS